MQKLVGTLNECNKLIPETIQALFSIVDLICEQELESIPLFVDNNIIDAIDEISSKYSSNVPIIQY